MYKEIKGDLIELSLNGMFDTITHGCNCFNTMGAGIALKMDQIFNANSFYKEGSEYYGDKGKLGTIDYKMVKNVIIINSYTQYHLGRNLDYKALQSCLTLINDTFRGKSIGLPKIGCGIAGGNWNIVRQMIIDTLVDMDVTVVIYE